MAMVEHTRRGEGLSFVAAGKEWEESDLITMDATGAEREEEKSNAGVGEIEKTRKEEADDGLSEENLGEVVEDEVSGHEEERKESGANASSSVILRIKRYPGLSVTVQYAEDGEDVEFERRESSDQTESSDSEEEGDEVDDDEPPEDTSQLLLTEARLKFLLENTRARRRGVGNDGNKYWDAEGLYTVDGDYDPLFLPQLESARVQANRSILVNRMAQLSVVGKEDMAVSRGLSVISICLRAWSFVTFLAPWFFEWAAFAMKLPPSGLYLAVLLLDFYWGHDRAMGRRMDAVQLQVLAYTCLYVASNRISAPGRTPDEFCRWAGVAERSVKGCMIIRQLEAFGTLLQGPEKVSSITSQSLWAHMKHVDPEEHMSKFIRHLEGAEYGRAYFTPAVLKDAYDVKGQPASTNTIMEDAGKVMKDRLLFASTRTYRHKRRSRGATMDDTRSSTNKPAKLVCFPKIAVL